MIKITVDINLIIDSLLNNEADNDKLINHLIAIQLENIKNSNSGNTKNEMMNTLIELVKIKIEQRY